MVIGFNGLPESEKPERRRYFRICRKAEAWAAPLAAWTDEKNFRMGEIENISLGGLLLKTEEHYQANDRLKIRIALPGWERHCPGTTCFQQPQEERPFTAVCEVLRSEKAANGYDTAARFIDITPYDFVALQGYLEDIPPPF